MDNQIDIENAVGKTIAYIERDYTTMLFVYTDKTFSIIRSSFMYDDLVLENEPFYFDEWDEEALLKHGVISLEWLSNHYQETLRKESERENRERLRKFEEYQRLKKEFGDA